MTNSKYLGIWMDHANANLMELSDPIVTQKLESIFSDPSNGQGVAKGESQLNNKDQQKLSSYYTKLGEIIQQYEEVVLFGPTNAKTELYNKIIGNLPYEKIKIEVKEADKMTENQQHAFVRDYFSKS